MSVRGKTAGLALGGLLASGCALVHQATLTFRIDTMQCSVAQAAGTVCSFFAYYGNVGAHSIQVEPSTTRVIDRTGRTFAPVAEAQTGDAFLLKPGLQHAISWSVTLPSNAKPASVTWHGSKASVQFESAGSTAPVPSASAVPSASVQQSASASVPATSAVPTTAAPTTTPAPTTTKGTVRPTKTKTPTKTPTKTTVPPTTPPPPTHTTSRPPVHHTTPAPTTNSTNPGGGSGGIG